jgi:hypothetical protein
MLYEARFIDHNDDVFATQLFGAENDGAAQDYAHKRLKTPFGKGHEVWQGDRLVHREIYK